MICRFEHSGLCCNSGSRHYEYECKKCECMIPISNAERIHSMTDEELADWMVAMDVHCDVCSEYKRCNGDAVFSFKPCDAKCTSHYLDWLKQPYKEDT
jgi:hypothetical protein